ncbi:uncharacterized protein BDR25DRAFT_355049 [Lindgomyces ingoldianus]|uniref:Uncharacterized protein n=1 Tax=Lindgomyces ingoldianus TaxID=673940 RepID=A0ACB6QWA2_9PLEO|nr:uncharacterized protein BDR25DRAFT_355049 [Lindgomyces ingoldianus]KAF2470562.1 hypothetical protein BDR25DRAFT_355049 [Lindgomyces ingoldianus]
MGNNTFIYTRRRNRWRKKISFGNWIPSGKDETDGDEEEKNESDDNNGERSGSDHSDFYHNIIEILNYEQVLDQHLVRSIVKFRAHNGRATVLRTYLICEPHRTFNEAPGTLRSTDCITLLGIARDWAKQTAEYSVLQSNRTTRTDHVSRNSYDTYTCLPAVRKYKNLAVQASKSPNLTVLRLDGSTGEVPIFLIRTHSPWRTLIAFSPAFFYYKDVQEMYGDSPSKTARKELHDLIAPLRNILPTLSAALFIIIPLILTHWTDFSQYIEQLIAGQDTLLHEKQHDRLLFNEFIPIIEYTITQYNDVPKWVSPNTDKLRKHRELRTKLEVARERLERRRTRATDLREGYCRRESFIDSTCPKREASHILGLRALSITKGFSNDLFQAL